MSLREAKCCHLASAPHPVLNLTAQLIDSANQSPPLRQLRSHVVNGLLQDNAFASSLAFQAGYQLGQSVEAFADCLSALLLCIAQLAIITNQGANGIEGALEFLPEAI
jgi:hypothetical protein